ncbi:precorrin-2 dehydrogenase/sirohydrochlorin ferrochelatase family protein [Desulfovulcanus sp.]
MRYYPIFLDLKDKTCLVIGAGKVGQRKIKTLLECGVKKIFVFDPYNLLPEDLSSHPCLEFKKNQIQPSDLDGVNLVFVCTNDKELNRFIALQCQKKNIFCNVANAPEKGDFILPSIFTQGDLCLAISTGGHSPALAKKIRLELESVFGLEYGLLTRLLSKIRPMVLSLGLEQQENASIFRRLVSSELLQALKLRERQRIEKVLKGILPKDLHVHIGGLIDDISKNF